MDLTGPVKALVTLPHKHARNDQAASELQVDGPMYASLPSAGLNVHDFFCGLEIIPNGL